MPDRPKTMEEMSKLIEAIAVADVKLREELHALEDQCHKAQDAADSLCALTWDLSLVQAKTS